MDYTHILNYATKYYLRYYPSRARLIEKLNEKFNPPEAILNKVLSSMELIILEEEVIKAKINYYKDKSKNLFYIRLKLNQKKFDKLLVEKYLEQLQEEWSLLVYSSLVYKVQNYYDKNKSINYVKNKLIERAEDREVVNLVVGEIYSSWEIPILSCIYNKNKTKYNLKSREWKQKFASKVLSAGFSRNDVKEFLSKFDD